MGQESVTNLQQQIVKGMPNKTERYSIKSWFQAFSHNVKGVDDRVVK